MATDSTTPGRPRALPRWLVPAVFTLGMAALHQFESPFVVPLGPVTLHPRELLLLGLLAYAALLVLIRRAEGAPHPLHYYVALYAAWLVWAAAIGLLRGVDSGAWLSELRYGIFLLAYPALVVIGARRSWVYGIGAAVLALAAAISFAALVFFLGRVTAEQTTGFDALGAAWGRRIEMLNLLYLPGPARVFLATIAALVVLGVALELFSAPRRSRYRARLRLVFKTHASGLAALGLGASALLAVFLGAWLLSRPYAGPVLSVQNYLGEFTRREYFGVLFQATRPSGHVFIEVGLVIVLGMLTARGSTPQARALLAVLAALYAAAIAIGFMRTAFAGIALSLVLLAWLRLPRALQGWSAALAAALVVLAGVWVLGTAADRPPPNVLAMDVTLRARAEEMRGAWAAFAEQPLAGRGLGSAFPAFGWVAKTSALAYAPAEFYSLHNVWMNLLLKGGLLGLPLALFGIGGVLVVALQRLPRVAGARDRALAEACVAALAGQLLVASIAMPRLHYPQGQALFALLVCALYVLTADTPKKTEGAPRRRTDGDAPTSAAG